jgi:hypothetical protein
MRKLYLLNVAFPKGWLSPDKESIVDLPLPAVPTTSLETSSPVLRNHINNTLLSYERLALVKSL